MLVVVFTTSKQKKHKIVTLCITKTPFLLEGASVTVVTRRVTIKRFAVLCAAKLRILLAQQIFDLDAFKIFDFNKQVLRLVLSFTT